MGFIADIGKAFSPAAQGNLLDVITKGQAQESYNNLLKAVGLGQQQAQTGQAGAQAGQDAQLQALQALQQQAQGGGPNPAQAALANATGGNVAQTAALMAGQRGTSGNPALAARQIGQAGANIQQQAAGQAALQQAQQQLGAQQALGNLGGQLVGQGQSAINSGVQSALSPLQAAQQQAQTSVANAGNINQAKASGIGIFAHGGVVEYPPGEDKLVPGDHEANDVVPTLLSPGEIVIPRSMAQDPKSASAFAYAVAMMSKRKGE